MLSDLFSNGGTIKQFLGGYSDYFEKSSYDLKNNNINEIKVKDSKQRPITTTKKLKFTFKEQREYEMIDDVIAALEERLKSIENSIIIEASNYINLEELIVEKEKLEQELAEQMDRWVYLNDLAEQISMI